MMRVRAWRFGVLCLILAVVVGGCGSEEYARVHADRDRPPGSFAASYYAPTRAERRVAEFFARIGEVAGAIGGLAASALIPAARWGFTYLSTH